MLNNLVLGRFITVQKKYLRRIRAGLHHLERGHFLKEDVPEYIEGLLGSISYLKLFDEKKAAKFVHKIRSHRWARKL